MITIRVFYKSSGKPASGKRVSVHFERFLPTQSEAFTDGNGDAHIDADPGTATVYVSGTNVYRGRVEGRTIVYV